MEKVTKNARIADLESKLIVMQTQINSLIECSHSHTKRLVALEPDNPFHGKFYEPSEPKLKQLDQSVFDGLDEKWRFAAVDADGVASYYNGTPDMRIDEFIYWDKDGGATQSQRLSGKFDTSNWQNSLIERDNVELTGSDLCRAMLERGDKAVLCLVIDNKETGVKRYDAITKTSGRSAFMSYYNYWQNATPINNQGEPLTAADVGL